MTQRLRERVETERFVLRRAVEDDLEPYCERIYGDAEVTRTLPLAGPLSLDAAIPRARANLVDHWERHRLGPWVVERKTDHRLLGHCGLRVWPDSDDIEVLFAIERLAWGDGAATETARMSLRVGFHDLALERIIAGVFPDNLGSVRVLEKIGMDKGELRDFAGFRVQMYEKHRARG